MTLDLKMLFEGIVILSSLHNYLIMFIGIVTGFVFGIIPGLSGLVALSLMLPLIYGMDPYTALVLLLSTHAVVTTGGSVSAILLGIPGTDPNAATIIDGLPMTQQGKGGRALGAGLMSSLMGGVFGAIVLVLLIPVLLPIAMAFRSPEMFLLILLGLLCIGALSKDSVLKGLLSGALGLIFSFIGFHMVSGMERFTFGSLYLYDGINLIPLGLGLFAIPVIIDLAGKGSSIAQTDVDFDAKDIEVWEGVKDVFKHFWLFLRCSVIGACFGILPGVGAVAATFVSYGHARSTSKNPDQFGQGAVEGVIAPEAANNAKEGGALLPTLVLGLPGSGAMAILLGAFILVGLEPGPLFLVEHMDIAIGMIWTLVISNVVAAAGGLFFCKKLAKIAFVPGHILAPLLLLLVFFGSFANRGLFPDTIMVLIFGAIGYGMRAFNYNRPAVLLGFILGPLAEKYFFIALKAHGPLFFLSSPLCIVLVVLLLLIISYGKFMAAFRRMRGSHESQTSS